MNILQLNQFKPMYKVKMVMEKEQKKKKGKNTKQNQSLIESNKENTQQMCKCNSHLSIYTMTMENYNKNY